MAGWGDGDGDDNSKPVFCSVLSIFRRPKLWHRRSSSTSSVHQRNPDSSPFPSSIRRHHGSDDTALVLSPRVSRLPVARAPIKYTPSAPANQIRFRRKAESPKALVVPSPSNGLSGELNSMIYDHQRTQGSSSLVRATSGNVMVYGNLGNLRGNLPTNLKGEVLDYLPTKKNGLNENLDSGYGNSVFRDSEGHIVKEPANWVMGNIVRKRVKEIETEVATPDRNLTRRLDPEELKKKGNAEYKKGRFPEALDFYDRAILINPQNASYRSNKAATLVGMGRLVEAVDECNAVLKIDPSHGRAHHRLATLYLRLGEANKALKHFNLSRNEASTTDISQSKTLQIYMNRCVEARRLGDWNTVLKVTKSAVSAGADSAPQVFALQAEALLKLDRHDDAENVFNRSPKYDIDASTKIFGATKNSYILMIRAEIDMASGRFEDAVGMAQISAQLDPGNRETSYVVRRAQGVASARSKGNDLFKDLKFGEACMAYQEGLQHFPRNAVLLCNRAACRSNLGQWERAVEDCNMALMVRPSYAKARLRRADCNAKLERWEASVRDYEILSNLIPGDEELSRGLSEARKRLNKQRSNIERNAAQS